MGEHARRKHKCLEVLGLPYTASDDDVKRAYRSLARQHHPDKNTEDGAKEKFQEISYAYKYLTEGPSGVGEEEEDDAEIPIEVLMTLFPWLFGGRHFFPEYSPYGFPRHNDEFFGNPYSNPFFPGFHRPTFYDSDEYVFDDDDDGEYFDYRESKSASSYVPGPSKEERKKEKRRKAKERKRTAKNDKPTPPSTSTTNGVSSNTQNTSAPTSHSSYRTPSSPASREASAGSSQKANYAQNIPSTSKSSYMKSSGGVASRDSSEARNSAAAREHSEKVTQGSTKKTKKQLQAEQIKREKEMESIKAEFIKRQKEQSEREARRRADKLELAEREAQRTADKQSQDRKDRQDRKTSCMSENISVNTEADVNSVITDINYSHGPTPERMVDELKGDNLKEIGDSKGDNSKDKLPSGGVKRKNRFPVDKKAQMDGNGTDRQKWRQNSASRKSRSTSRSGSKPRMSAGYSTSQEPKSSSHSRKEHREARKKANHEVEWSDAEYDDLMPQNEAEEMRMYHDAIHRSTQQTGEQSGNTFLPRSSEEERSMLEEARRESQSTSSWHSNIDCVDDIPNVASPSEFQSFHSTSPIVFGDLGNWLPDSEDDNTIGKDSLYSQTSLVEDRFTGGENHLHPTISVFDMDDIDDCDTIGDDGSHSYGLASQTSSTYDLGIPTAINKEMIKSYYKRKK